MANVTLLFRKEPSQIGSIVLDCSVSEQHQADVDVTDSPVERGANISDHARPKPETLTLEGLITNAPLSRDPLSPSTAESLAGSIDTGFISRAQGDPTRAVSAYQDLRDLKDAGELIEVVTSLRSYSDMVLTNLSVPRDAKTGECLKFTATFKQIRVVENKKVIVQETKAKPKVDLAVKPATPVAAPKDPRSTAAFLQDVGHASAKDGFPGFLKAAGITYTPVRPAP